MSKLVDIDRLFNGRHFDREVIVLYVRWYLRATTRSATWANAPSGKLAARKHQSPLNGRGLTGLYGRAARNHGSVISFGADHRTVANFARRCRMNCLIER